jgi:hypothetical protein
MGDGQWAMVNGRWAMGDGRMGGWAAGGRAYLMTKTAGRK